MKQTNRFLIFLVLFICIESVGVCALIPPHYLNSVVAIGVRTNKNTISWIGTGFLFGKFISQTSDQISKYHIFLVSNKHVFQGKNDIYIKFNPTDDSPAQKVPLSLRVDNIDQWTGHPNPNVDVAVIQINPNVLEQQGLKFQFFRSDAQPRSIKNMKQATISEGDGIFVLGYPMGIVGKTRQYVICRRGCIARVRGFIEGADNDFLIDASVFPGNSGGPVILQPNVVAIKGTRSTAHANLIGIVKSYIPYQDSAISRQTHRARIVFEENSGLASVEPIDHIIETIELEFEHNPK